MSEPLRTGVGLENEFQPKAIVTDWTQIVRARTWVEDKAAILAIGPEDQAQDGRPRPSLGALLLFNDDSPPTEWWKE